MRVRLRVTEIRRHHIIVEMTEEDLEDLQDMPEEVAAEMIGDRMSNVTLQDGDWEDPEVSIVDK